MKCLSSRFCGVSPSFVETNCPVFCQLEHHDLYRLTWERRNFEVAPLQSTLIRSLYPFLQVPYHLSLYIYASVRWRYSKLAWCMFRLLTANSCAHYCSPQTNTVVPILLSSNDELIHWTSFRWDFVANKIFLCVVHWLSSMAIKCFHLIFLFVNGLCNRKSNVHSPNFTHCWCESKSNYFKYFSIDGTWKMDWTLIRRIALKMSYVDSIQKFDCYIDWNAEGRHRIRSTKCLS